MSCKPGLWRRDMEREQKSNYFRKPGYSLLQISRAAWKKNQTQINLFVAQLMPLLKVLCSQRSSNFLRTRLVRSQCTGPGSANQWHGVPPQFEWDLGKICVGKTPKSEGGHIATYWNPHWNGTDIFRSAVSEPGWVKTWPWWYLSQYMGAYTVARLSRWCS